MTNRLLKNFKTFKTLYFSKIKNFLTKKYFLIDKSYPETFIIDSSGKLENSFSLVLENYYDLKCKGFIKYSDCYVTFKSNYINVSFYDKSHYDRKTIKIKYTEISKNEKNILFKKIWTLKQNFSSLHKKEHINEEDYNEKLKYRAILFQEIFSDFIQPILKNHRFIEKFSDLSVDAQEKIKNQNQNFSDLQKKIKLISNLFQITLTIKFNCEFSRGNPEIVFGKNTLNSKNIKDITEFLNNKNLPTFNKIQITPTGTIIERFLDKFDFLRVTPETLTSHERLKLKKEFLKYFEN